MGALCGGPNTKDCKIYGEEYKEKNLFIITCVDGGKKGTCPAADAKNGSILACQGTNSVSNYEAKFHIGNAMSVWHSDI